MMEGMGLPEAAQVRVTVPPFLADNLPLGTALWTVGGTEKRQFYKTVNVFISTTIQ